MRTVALVLILAGPAIAADWQTGQLVDSSSERVFTGTTDGVFGQQARYASMPSYVIRSGDREFVISVRPAPGLLRPRMPHVVVNTPVRFRVDKRKVTLLDDDGKEYKGQVEREALVKP